ncbi:hypothetical protein ACQVRV_20925 (plasmid) [Ralstonia pseudosolanacearum]
MRALLLVPPVATLPVWVAQIGQRRLGANLQGGWCIGVGELTIPLSKPEDMMPLLPLLELNREKFYEHLHRVAEDHVEILGGAQSFPETLLLRFAFESSVSEYWPMKAIEWLEGVHKIEPDVRESLRLMLSKTLVTQRLRQRVAVLIKRSE